MLSLALVGLIAGGAFAQTAMQPAQIQHFNVVNDGPRQLTTPPVYMENTLGTQYLPSLGDFGDDLHTTYSTSTFNTNPLTPSATVSYEGYYLGWYSADTTPQHGDHSYTVDFYANDPDDSSIDYGNPIFTYTHNEVGGAGVTGLRNDFIEFDSPVTMPSDVWMYVQFDAAHPKTGMLIAADWPYSAPFYGGDPGTPNATSAAEYGFSHWWFATSTPSLTYFGAPYGGGGFPLGYNPPGNFLMGLYGVPEPTTIGLLAMGGLALLRRRR
jgi:hypothetical protein